MIKVNEYFDGKVKSFGYTPKVGKSTVGVMDIGEFVFNTSSHEVMTIVEGAMTVQLKGESDWKTYSDGQSFEVPANSAFTAKVEVQTSYLCKYE